jgi:hypothetical protein
MRSFFSINSGCVEQFGSHANLELHSPIPYIVGVQGILRLGRFLLWLCLFLFAYSSIMILFQYGRQDYGSQMVTSWGSIGQEFQKSYEALTAAPAPTESQGTEAGETGKSEATGPPGYFPLLVWGSVIICLLGFFWIVAAAFQESLLWGLAVLFIPFVLILFWISHIREATPPFVLVLIGNLTLGFSFTYFDVDWQEYFIGSPPELRPKQPSPLEESAVPKIFVVV